MEVELSKAQIAPARGRDLRLPKPGDERPQDHDARPHLAYEVVRGSIGAYARSIYRERIPGELGGGPEALEDGEHRLHVLYARHIVEHGPSRCQECRRDEFQGCVLGPGDLDLSAK